MVLEGTGIGQLEFGVRLHLIFSFLERMKPVVGAVGMWKSGALVFGRISKPGGKRGKLALGF
jgi:hypothetical protein